MNAALRSAFGAADVIAPTQLAVTPKAECKTSSSARAALRAAPTIKRPLSAASSFSPAPATVEGGFQPRNNAVVNNHGLVAAMDLGYLEADGDLELLEFGVADALSVKKVERTTNHDVKAIEYVLKDKFRSDPELSKPASPTTLGTR